MITLDDIKQASQALDDLDDCARMDAGINAVGSRTTLEQFIAMVKLLVEQPCIAVPAHQWQDMGFTQSQYNHALEHGWQQCTVCHVKRSITREKIKRS